MDRRNFIVGGVTIAGSLLVDSSVLHAQTARPSAQPGRSPSMKFINFVKYRDLDKIAAARTAHFAYADRLREQGLLAVGGPLLDDQARRIGLLFIYTAVSRDAALTLARE